MRYRISYQIDGELEYLYFEYMMQVGAALRGILLTTTDWHIETLEEDGKYHELEG